MPKHRQATNEVKVTVCPGYVGQYENPKLFQKRHEQWVHHKILPLSKGARKHVAGAK